MFLVMEPLDIPMCYLLHGLGVKLVNITGGIFEEQKPRKRLLHVTGRSSQSVKHDTFRSSTNGIHSIEEVKASS